MEICRNLSFNNAHDSNLFLRKLWSELEENNGWCFSPIRDGNKIYIGQCNYGQVSFDYGNKGCIKNIYFTDVSSDNASYVKDAVDRAKRIEEVKSYYVLLELPFLTCGMNIGKIQTEFLLRNNTSYLYFKINAYSQKDLEYLLSKKVESIRALMSVYIRKVFPFECYKITYSSKIAGEFDTHDVKLNYDMNWVDLDEIPKSEEGYYIFPEELLILIDKIINNIFFPKEIDMIINSAHAFYSATYQAKLSMENTIDMIGCTNIADSIAISALEPLANLENVPTTVCEKCGAQIFSVVKKMRILLERYLDSRMAKYIMDEYYAKRSMHFHEGIRDTEEYYIGVCWPQINERNGKSILMPHSLVSRNLFDFVSFIIRKRIFDIINKQ